jgi:hypothetical protein
MKGDSQAAAPFVARIGRDMRDGIASPVTLAWMYSLQHQYPEAIELLEQAAAWKDRRLLYLKVSPFLENLHDQPRYSALVKKMRL